MVNPMEIAMRDMSRLIDLANANADTIPEVINANGPTYGAKGDGSDSTAALQKAIDAAQNAGRSEVYLAPGSYVYTTLTNTSGIVFVGDGVTVSGSPVIPVISPAQLNAQLAGKLNIEAFGGRGDGITDNTTAISNMIQWVKEHNGAVVFFPPGIYNTQTNVFENVHNLVIYGYGACLRVTEIFHNSPKRAPLAFENSSNISIFGIEVDGQYDIWTDPPANAVNHCLSFLHCQNILIEDCYLHDAGNQRDDSDKRGDGIYVAGDTSTNIRIINTRIVNCARWGIAILAGDNIHIEGVDYIWDKPNIVRLGFINLEYSSNPRGHNIVITNNTSFGSTQIKLSGVNGFDNVNVSNNILDGRVNGAAATYVGLGFRFDDVLNLVVANNQILNAYGEGMYFENCDTVFLTDNNVNGLSQRAVQLAQSTTNVIISGGRYVAGRDITQATAISISPDVSGVLIKQVTLVSPYGFGIDSDGQNVKIVDVDITAVGNNGFRLLSNPHWVEGVTVNGGSGAGRLSAHAHTVINNRCTIVTSNGVWINAGGYFRNPDISYGGRSVIHASAAPTGGTWSAGDIIFNNAPSAGGYVGWVCVTGGSPGTWKGFGTIES